MKRVIGLFVVLLVPLALGGDNADDIRKELTSLEGTWKAVSMEAAGTALPKESMPAFTFIVGPNGKCTGKTIGKLAQSEYEATMTVDPAKDPRTIDNAHETGTHKGKTQYGVYKLEGEKWTVCMTAPGAALENRPKDFNTKGTANALFVFERVREEKKQ